MHQGKVALVTGAGRGIGQAYALRLARDGADIIIVDAAPMDETERLIRAIGRDVLVLRGDVSSPEDVAAVSTHAIERFGRCDILVNNAGIYPEKPFSQITFEEWRRVLSINLDGAFLMCQAFVPHMMARKWGRIVNQSSQTTHVMVRGLVPYVASKLGVVGLTRALAADLGEYGITVNAISPGLTRTPGTLGQWGDEVLGIVAKNQAIPRVEQPEDLVGALSFLASQDAAFITGQVLNVNGGWIFAG